MGETTSFQPWQGALVRVPPVRNTRVRRLRDGAAVHEAPGDVLLRAPVPGPGVYRVEVDLRVGLFPITGIPCRPWICSNPVCIRG